VTRARQRTKEEEKETGKDKNRKGRIERLRYGKGPRKGIKQVRIGDIKGKINGWRKRMSVAIRAAKEIKTTNSTRKGAITTLDRNGHKEGAMKMAREEGRTEKEKNLD
jgi:hypothetical protein